MTPTKPDAPGRKSKNYYVPKMKPCAKCKTDEGLAIYTYEGGWKHVECDICMYLGRASGSMRGAVLNHNEEMDKRNERHP